jgi:hypothetical protein
LKKIHLGHAFCQESLNADSPPEFLVRCEIKHADFDGRPAPHFCEGASHHQTMLEKMQLCLGFNFIELLLIHKLGKRVRTLGVEKHPEEFDCFEESLIPTIHILLTLLKPI